MAEITPGAVEYSAVTEGFTHKSSSLHVNTSYRAVTEGFTHKPSSLHVNTSYCVGASVLWDLLQKILP